METDKSDRKDARNQRIATGIALGLPFGAALSLLLDNWVMLSVGLMLGLAFGAMPLPETKDDDDVEKNPPTSD